MESMNEREKERKVLVKTVVVFVVELATYGFFLWRMVVR